MFCAGWVSFCRCVLCVFVVFLGWGVVLNLTVLDSLNAALPSMETPDSHTVTGLPCSSTCRFVQVNILRHNSLTLNLFRVLNQLLLIWLPFCWYWLFSCLYVESVRLPAAVSLLFCLIYGIMINVLFWPGGLRCVCVWSSDFVSGTIVIGLFFLLGQIAFTNLHHRLMM